MKILRKLSPHAVILIGNMYYVFWGIDRVNKAMSFIDNGLTKFLLLIAFSAVNASVLWTFLKKQLRFMRTPRRTYARMAVLGLNAALCAVILVLLAVNLASVKSMLFLNELVKALVLIICITGQLCAVYMASRQRAGARRRTAARK